MCKKGLLGDFKRGKSTSNSMGWETLCLAIPQSSSKLFTQASASSSFSKT